MACDLVVSGHARRGYERARPQGLTSGVTHAIHIEGIGCHEMIRIRSCLSSMLFGNVLESRRLDMVRVPKMRHAHFLED